MGWRKICVETLSTQGKLFSSLFLSSHQTSKNVDLIPHRTKIWWIELAIIRPTFGSNGNAQPQSRRMSRLICRSGCEPATDRCTWFPARFQNSRSSIVSWEDGVQVSTGHDKTFWATRVDRIFVDRNTCTPSVLRHCVYRFRLVVVNAGKLYKITVSMQQWGRWSHWALQLVACWHAAEYPHFRR